MECLLCDLEKGQEGVLLNLRTVSPLQRKLRQFGLIAGTRISSLGSAPGGSPMLFRVRGMTLALRREDCCKIPVVIL